MDDEEALHLLLVLAGDVAHHLAIVAVAGEGVDAAQLGAHLMALAEDGDLLVAAHNLGTEGAGFAIAYAEHSRRLCTTLVLRAIELRSTTLGRVIHTARTEVT